MQPPPSLYGIIIGAHKAVIAGIYHFQVEILLAKEKIEQECQEQFITGLLTFHVEKLRQ